MLGQYNMFPLLKGWDYETHVVENRAVVRGVEPMTIVEVDRILEEEMGWLKSIIILSDDAYGTLEIEYRGAARKKVERYSFYAEAVGRTYGSWGPADPGGSVQRYQRPNPYSTAGIYVIVAFAGGFSGAAWPYMPPVHLRLYLPPESTQPTAYIRAECFVIAITDEDEFVESLAKVASKGIELDPSFAGFLERVEGSPKRR